MKALLLRRLATFLPTLVFISIIVFLLRSLIPGGPAAALVGTSGADEAAMERITKDLGLDQPLPVQYLTWVGDLVQGDLGQSYITRVPVSSIVSARLEPTLVMVIGSVVLATALGTALGLFAAVRSGTRSGKIAFTASGVGLSIPPFWLATIAAGAVGISLGWLPSSGYVPLVDGVGQTFRTVLMPVVVMALPAAALIARQVRAGMVVALASPYVRTARAMGLSRPRIYFDLAFRNAVAPLITFLPLVIAGLVGASVVVESVFTIPGLGRAIVDAVSNRDYATLQAVVLLLAVVVLLLNLIADITLALLDPRIRNSH